MKFSSVNFKILCAQWLGVGLWWAASACDTPSQQAATTAAADSAHCHTGVPARSAQAMRPGIAVNVEWTGKVRILGTAQPSAAASAAASAPETRPKQVPEGMVYVPGGLARIGDDKGGPNESPAFWVEVAPFLMDEHPVTVAQFRRFVQATGYVTQAEQFGNSGVISEQTQQRWAMVAGANWHHPQGPAAPPAPDNHPVTQVSWNDAQAYCRWAGRRLPSELEWEHAARNARNDQSLYPWGNELAPNGKYLANTWQGDFPTVHQVKDGHAFTSPVGYYGKSPLGLADMAGNVWEWCAEWHYLYTDLAQGRATEAQAVRSAQGEMQRVMRGGSFLCEPGWCHGYRVSGRSFSSPETGLMHVGFRTVKDLL